MSYQEKSTLGSLLAMLIIYSFYFAGVVHHRGDASYDGKSLARLMATVVALIVVEIVYHIILAIGWKAEPKDERDLLIEGKSYRNAYLLLSTGAALVLAYIIVVGLMQDAATGRALLTPFVTVNLLLLAMVGGSAMKYLTQIFYYRRGL